MTTWHVRRPLQPPIGWAWNLDPDDPRVPWLRRLLGQVPLVTPGEGVAEWLDMAEVDPERELSDDQEVVNDVSGFEAWMPARP